MNCFYHPTNTAVAQCVICGKGLCYKCATANKRPICPSCSAKENHSKTIEHLKPLLICGVLYVVGYNINIMNSDQTLSGYLFMSIYAGWKVISQFLPNIFVWFNIEAIFWYYLIRIALSMIIGALTTPFYLGWSIYRLITIAISK